jgi:tripartite-type tricarboxylate transporter receptor subunit TctC
MMLRIFPAIVAMCAATNAIAQGPNDWPQRNITLVIPYPAGSGTDVPGRMIAQKLSDELGQPVVVENRTGASGTLGADFVAKSAPDGYTIGLVTGTTQSLAPNLEPKPRYDAVKDFAPIGMIGTVPFLLVAFPGTGAETVAELTHLAKSRPGSLTFGSAGTASDTYFAALLYAQAAGLEMNHVPYRASAAAIPDLLSGRVQLQFATIAPVAPLVKEGKLKGLAVTSRERSSALPSLPTMIEAGVPNYEAVLWMALVAPANTPTPIVQKLNTALNKVLVEVKAQLQEQGVEPGGSKPEDVKTRTIQELAKWKDVVAKSGPK